MAAETLTNNKDRFAGLKSLIIPSDIPKPPEELDTILEKFSKVSNRVVETDDGDLLHVEIGHLGKRYRVQIAKTEAEILAVKQLDDEVFAGHVGITREELTHISQHGAVLFLKNSDGVLVAESQVITSSIPEHQVESDEVYCYGTAVKPNERGKGYAQVLFKAQEVIGRRLLYNVKESKDEGGKVETSFEFNKTRMSLTVRPENAASIRSRFALGYRIVAYDPERYGPASEGGARFIMEKVLHTESLPFDIRVQSRRYREGLIPLVQTQNDLAINLGRSAEAAIYIYPGEEPDLEAQELSKSLLASNYVGVGILKPSEAAAEKSVLVFQKSDFHPPIEPLTRAIKVSDDFSKLREVIVSHSPTSAIMLAGDMENLINRIARANALNFDTISAFEEHQRLIGALKNLGINIIHSSAFPNEEPKGKSQMFTRDPGIVLGDTFIIGNMARTKRRYETEGMRRESKGMKVLDVGMIDKTAFVEGGDIIPLDESVVVVGLGDRTNEQGYNILVNAFPNKVFIGVKHPDLHLDVLFTVLGKDKVLADVTKLPQEFLTLLRNNGYTIVEADTNEQAPLGCNVLAVDNDKVIAVKENPITNQRLRDAGVEVTEVSMPNIIKKGGGPRCLTCPTHRD